MIINKHIMPEVSCLKNFTFTIRQTAKALGMSLSTAFSWRHKILSVSETMTDTMLTETVEVNEFWLKENFKGCRNIKQSFLNTENRNLIFFLELRGQPRKHAIQDGRQEKDEEA